jgi:CBS domain containing-hemolysin-like protein
LILSGFFSGSEVALFGVEKKKINFYLPNKTTQRYLSYLLSSPRRLLISILIGNNLVNVAISIISVLLVTDLASVYGLNLSLLVFIQITVITVLILIFGELLPKVLATKYQIKFLRIITVPLYYYSVIVFPVSELLSEFIRVATSRLKFSKKKFVVESSEISDISKLSGDLINLNREEKEILESLNEFKEIVAREIMTHRVDIVALSDNEDIDEAINIVTRSGHSRIPVYEKNIDNIIGILHAKDLLKYSINPKLKTGVKLRDLIKRPMFIPESKKINDLLDDFQSKKNHIAIVVDEYGGTAGLITLEDIIEEVIGDIWDEFDKSELKIIKISDNTYIVNAYLTFNEFESETKIQLNIQEKIKSESFAVFLLGQFKQIPEQGTFVEINGLRITVVEIAKKRIKKVKLELSNN